MAEPVQVYRCDRCNRVVAEVRDGKLVLVQRHDAERHETVIMLGTVVKEIRVAGCP